MALKKLKDMSPTERLLAILSYRRPHNSEGERVFVERFVVPMKDLPHVKMERCEGATIFTVPHKAGDKRPLDTLFSCHVDTVHSQGGTQKVLYDPNMMLAYKDDKEPLGADDGAGVWIMTEMMRRRVPGVYAFHRGEERGCIGSGWVAANKADWLKQFKRAIAFDRRDNDSVITKQRSRECCSDFFAAELAGQLNHLSDELKLDIPFDYKPDPTGIYTDTAQYDHIIPECTNLSVGYTGQHTAGETQDCHHLINLLEVAVELDWHDLATVRVPVAKYKYNAGSHFFGGGYGWDGDDLAGWPPGTTRRKPVGFLPHSSSTSTSTTSDAQAKQTTADPRSYLVEVLPNNVYDPFDFVGSSEEEVLEHVIADPAGIAEFIVLVSDMLAGYEEETAAPEKDAVLDFLDRQPQPPLPLPSVLPPPKNDPADNRAAATPNWFVEARQRNEAALRALQEERARRANDPGAVKSQQMPPIPD